MVLALVFTVFTILILNMFIKHIIQLSCVLVFCLLFLGFVIISCLAEVFFLIFALLLCLCVNVLHVFYLFTNLRIIIHQHVLLFFHIHANIDKDANYFQSNDNTSSKNLWLIFSASFSFLNVWFNKSGNILLRRFYFYLFICCFFYTSTLKPQIIMNL